MNKKLIYIFLTSLFSLEILSFLFVYHSNLSLYKTLNSLKDAGHMVIPNGHVLLSLEQIMPAFYSSLFILFTAGILVSLLICLLTVIFFLNPIFARRETAVSYFSIFFAALTVSGIALFALADQSTFLRARDYLLLSNPPGIAINNFYYAYTPYVTRAINPTSEKQVKPGWMNPAFFVRALCGAGLFTGLPVFGFILLLWFIFRICRKLMAEKKAMILSGILISGMTVIALLYLNPINRPGTLKGIEKMLGSQRSKVRIEALRILYQKGEDIWQFPDYCRTHVSSNSIAERYWLANAFSKSNTIKSVQYLKKLLKDDAINVKCAAINALSKLICNDESDYIFKDLIINSPEWYVQQYAYTAYKKCQ